MNDTAPTSKEYKRASAIVRKFAEAGIAPYHAFRLFRPFKTRYGFCGILSNKHYNWGMREIEMWEDIYSKVMYRRSKVKTTERVTLSKSAVKKRRLIKESDRLRIQAGIQRKVEAISKEIGHIHTIAGKAYAFDFLFVNIEPDAYERHAKLKRLFSKRIKVEDELWANIVWDYTRKDVIRRLSQKLTKKYVRPIKT